MRRGTSRYPGDITRRLMCFGAVALAMMAASSQAAPSKSPRAFATPQEAVRAMIEAAEHNDTAALLKLFGPEGKDIVDSGDPAEDQDRRVEFVRLAHEKMQFDQDPTDPDKTILSVGDQEWPFPVPLIRKEGKWQFDSARGRLEILARRIGRNEMNAMEVCRGYVEAQLEYAAEAHNGDGILQYAQKVVSSSGKHDGVYWDGAPESLVSKGFARAAVGNFPAGGGKSEPYHGYYFRTLRAQGSDAAGGAFDYVVKGKMIGGFALVAWPAEYGLSGVRTLIINHQGVIYQKDLGTNTARLARQMTRFNPDKSWRPVHLE
ncbi:MAG TPA: DUF2950 domain-containing protein [Candidatus Binatia bacterium]